MALRNDASCSFVFFISNVSYIDMLFFRSCTISSIIAMVGLARCDREAKAGFKCISGGWAEKMVVFFEKSSNSLIYRRKILYLREHVTYVFATRFLRSTYLLPRLPILI